MTKLIVKINGTTGKVVSQDGHLTTGMVGAQVIAGCCATWEGLTKTAVFRAGDVTRDVVNVGEIIPIPQEVLAEPTARLQFGLYGVDSEGVTVLPTVWVNLGQVLPGADPSGDESTDPTLPVWAQIQQEVDSLGAAVNGAKAVDPDVHAEYFAITDEGVVSLKPAYRGANDRADCPDAISDNGTGAAGSKNAELPKHLIIPEIVNGVAVGSLAKGIFRRNNAVINVTLPSTITAIPDRCFDQCLELRNVYGTENIKTLGSVTFQKTAISRLNLPNLEQMTGIAHFNICKEIVYADLGKIAELPSRTFDSCNKLNMVKGGNINSVGDKCFMLTPNLKQADFLSGVKNIGAGAFLRSGIDCDWASLDGCTFGSNATPLQYNPADYWSACTFTPRENRLPTHLCQSDDRWMNRPIGTTGEIYNEGCQLFTYMHIYCGLHNLALSTVEEFEEIVNGIDENWLNEYVGSMYAIKPHLERLGLSVAEHSQFNQASTQALYDALADGNYAIIQYDEPELGGGHTVVAYGINSKGELLIADSNPGEYTNGKKKAMKYALPVSKLRAADNYGSIDLCIVSM